MYKSGSTRGIVYYLYNKLIELIICNIRFFFSEIIGDIKKKNCHTPNRQQNCG